MKRIIAWLLVAALCLGCVPALAAEKYSSQPEKLALQFMSGSGIKGSLTFQAEGDAEWAQKVASISGVEMQLRALDEVNGGYQVRLYVSEDGHMQAVTELFSDGGDTAWLQSDFLMGRTYAFPADHDLLSGLTGIGYENPTWYSVLLHMLLQISDESWNESWSPELESAYQVIDLWLAPYASGPEMLEVDGEKRMLVRYQVPADMVKQAMKSLLPVVLGNQRLTKLMNTMMSGDQAEIYLHQGYTWYYEQIINGLPLEGDLVLERQFSTLGEDYSTLLTFPVANGPDGLREVTVVQEDGNTTLNLIFASRTVLVTATPDREGNVMGTVRVYNENDADIALGYELSRTKTAYTDEKERDHEDYHWELNVAPELSFLGKDDPLRAAYLDFEPFTVDLMAAFYSKSGDTTAVTLNLKGSLISGGSQAGFTATIKTASPWYMPDAYTGETVSLAEMDAQQRNELFQDWLNNGMLVLASMQPEAEETATATDLAEVE